MRIRMLVDVSGMRNGQPWPPKGTVIDLPDEEALQYCETGMAVPVPDNEIETATRPAADEEQRGPVTTQTGPARRVKRS